MEKCINCNGTGYTRFQNKGGVCFECGGKGKTKSVKRKERSLREIVLIHKPFTDLFSPSELEANISWGERKMEEGKSLNYVLDAFNRSMDRRAAMIN